MILRPRGGRTLMALALAAPLAACASAGIKVDLDGARAALAEAKEAEAPVRAPDSYGQAEKDLQRAEVLEAGRDVPRDRRGAQAAAVLAVTEAHCATALSRALVRPEQTATKAQAAVAASTAEVDRLNLRAKKLEEEQHKLEEKIAVLTRDLEVTETELIRTKARLKGNETKAEASAAIAEARILAGRMAEDKSAPSVLARSEESLAKAEEQLTAGNYGAALFFASKAQDLVARVKEGNQEATPGTTPATPANPPIPSLTSYVSTTGAHVRREPSLSGAILGIMPAGTHVLGEAVSGAWVKVTYKGISGWVHSSLLQ